RPCNGLLVSRSIGAPSSKLQHIHDLLASDSRKPFDDFVNGGATLELLKNYCNWYACIREDPRTAYFSGYAFNAWTLGPIERHRMNLSDIVDEISARAKANIVHLGK